jgi:cytochrome b
MGGWSVLALLGLLVVQVGLGLFAVDPDGVNAGPLDRLVSFETGRKITHLHGLVFNILLAFIALHVIAVLFYLLYKRENLIAAMFRGFKTAPMEENMAPPRIVSAWWAIPGLLVSAAIVYWLVTTRF